DRNVTGVQTCALPICGQVAAGELTGPGWSVEDRALRAGALQLVEAWEGGHRDHPVPEPPSILALRGRGDHRAEERGAVERHHRRSEERRVGKEGRSRE